MTVSEIRRQNILTWAEKIGRSCLAERLGYKDTTYINQLCAGHGSFGGRTARKIESALGLAPGWFDLLHPDESPQTSASRLAEEIKTLSDNEARHMLAYIELLRQLRQPG